MKDKMNVIKYLALLAGAIAMIFSGLDWQIGIFAWIAPICLLYYSRNSRAVGFIIFFVFMSLAGYFSQSCNNLFDIFAIGILNGISYGIITTVIYLVDKLLYTKAKGFYSTLIFPSVVVIFEFLISSKIGTWGIIAHSQYSFSPLIQLSSITGVFGITFIVIWFASIVNWINENNFSKQSIRKGVFIYGSIFLSIIVFGILKVSLLSDNTKTVKVATISGNTDIHGMVEKEQTEFFKIIENPQLEFPERIFADENAISFQIENTISAAKEGAKIIVWSEDALILNHTQLDYLLAKTKTISKTYNAYILLAILEKDNDSSPKPFNNKSIFISPTGTIAWEYLKSHLHPYAEVPIINQGNGLIPYIDTEYGRIGNVICYDLDFPNFIYQTSKNSIDIMLVPSYDWEKITPLHSNMACFEAIQNGFSLIRANGAGLNIITNSHGNIIDEMNTFMSNSKILYADLPLKSVKTVYSVIGNTFVYILMLFLFIIIGLKIARR